MKKDLPSKLLALGRNYEKVRALEARATALRKAFAARYQTGGWWSSASRGPDHLKLSIALPLYLETYPDEKPTLRAWTSDHDGAEWASMDYPPHFVGWLRPGFALWVETSTPAVITKPAPAITEQPAAQAAA